MRLIIRESLAVTEFAWILVRRGARTVLLVGAVMCVPRTRGHARLTDLRAAKRLEWLQGRLIRRVWVCPRLACDREVHRAAPGKAGLVEEAILIVRAGLGDVLREGKHVGTHGMGK